MIPWMMLPWIKRTAVAAGRFIPILVVFGVLGGAWWSVHHLGSGDHEELHPVAEPGQSGQSASVELSAGKRAAADLQSAAATEQTLQHRHTLPGRIQYDEAGHAEVRSASGGILLDVRVKPGDRVTEGQLLAVISSPAVGRARADVLKWESELALVEERTRRSIKISENVQLLLGQLDQQSPISAIERTLNDRVLGQFGKPLLASYSELLLARQVAQQTHGLAESGAIAGRVTQQRESARQIAEAAFRAAREDAVFNAQQQRRQAEVERADAKRQLAIARHQLETLLGYPETTAATETAAAATAGAEALTARGELSKLEVRAPFAGTIEQRFFAKSERVSSADALFVLADTRTMYVVADIRDNDWAAVSLRPGQEVDVTSPALPEERYPARVHYIGREMALESNSVPLIAIIDNRAGLWRPGMFVRIAVPIGKPRTTLAVHPAAVMRHEDQQFVFVEQDRQTYRRADVHTGLATDHWVEVLAGIQPGERVVDRGAFLLKSELLLSGESE